MARSLTLVVALLSTLPSISVCAAFANTCQQFPVPLLKDYPLAKTFCSSYYPVGGPKVTPAPQAPSCARGDSRCSIFSELLKDTSTIAADLCSCIEKPITTATASCTASPVTITSTISSTLTATVTSIPPHQTATVTMTIVSTQPPLTITTTVFSTQPPSTITATVTATVTTTHSTTCTPVSPPPSGSTCDQAALNGGVPLFVLSPAGNTAASVSACEQQCLAASGCESFSFDGTNCVLFSQSVLQLELGGVMFPVNQGVAGAVNLYDQACFKCA